MSGFTGTGESLTKLKSTYDKVQWDTLELPWAKARPGPGEFTLGKLEVMRKAAVTEMNGNAALLRTQALATRDVAQKTEAQFKANKAIPSSSAALCSQIAIAAEYLGNAVNTNSLGTFIANDAALVREPYDVTFNALKNKLPQFVSALEKGLNAVGEPTQENWAAQGMMTLCRNLNQNIGNVPKLTLTGYDVGIDTNTATAFFKQMEPYAAKDRPFTDLEDGKKAKLAVAALISQAKNIK